MATGANTTPLGNPRFSGPRPPMSTASIGGGGGGSLLRPSYITAAGGPPPQTQQERDPNLVPNAYQMQYAAAGYEQYPDFPSNQSNFQNTDGSQYTMQSELSQSGMTEDSNASAPSSRKRSRSRERKRRSRSRSRDRRRRSRSRSRDRRRRSRSRDRHRRSKSRDRDRRSRSRDRSRRSRSRSKDRDSRPSWDSTVVNTSMNDNSQDSKEARRNKKRSRWAGGECDKVFIPGMPTILPGNMTSDQTRAYLLQLQIEELSRRLRMDDLGIPANPEERSPSPEPIYNAQGKRMNTREFRVRKRLEDERHNLVQEMTKINPDFKPPVDYKPPSIRISEKVMIPQEQYPDINFVGLLLGPRGNTLKTLEKDTGAKITIRGKGSTREGKVGKDGQPHPGEDEPLHALCSGLTTDVVQKAVKKITQIIKDVIETPEGQNDLRRSQLRELALLNGTLREGDEAFMRCNNCGATTHKSWQCPDKPNVTNNVICSSCGGAGHIARDCRNKMGAGGTGSNWKPQGPQNAKIDQEYMSLMAELGEGPPPDMQSSEGNQRNFGGSGVLGGRSGPMKAIQGSASSHDQRTEESQSSTTSGTQAMPGYGSQQGNGGGGSGGWRSEGGWGRGGGRGGYNRGSNWGSGRGSWNRGPRGPPPRGPPPPGSRADSSTAMEQMGPWGGMGGHMMPPWNQQPPPGMYGVPPPWMYGGGPPMVPPPGSEGGDDAPPGESGIDFASLLSAPPPPPPPS